MAENEEESGLMSPIRGLKRVISDGYYASSYAPDRQNSQPSDDGATYIPDQADPFAVAVNEAVRHGPFFLAFRDLWTCLTMFALFPGVITPFWTKNETDEFYLWGKNLWGLFLLSFASTFEVILLLAVVPLFLLLPGPIAVSVFAVGQFFVHIICYGMQGPSKVWSKTPEDPKLAAQHEKNQHERWFFLNGCCVSGHNLQHNVNVLSETFGRPIFAIHNRTYGVLGDLFECILQRNFDLFTEETRVCYEYVKSYVIDPEVSKCVVIAHSQGCIMASQILDQLYVDLPAEAVSKLEVYTFGNAAAHFNNPLRRLTNQSGSLDARDTRHTNGDHTDIYNSINKLAANHKSGSKGQIASMLPERVVPYIEHYCNSQDMVTRWGALYSAKAILQNRFCGHIFINEGASGHMLNQHYMQEMFPIHHRRAGAGHMPGTASDTKHHGVAFLDRFVRVDTATVTQRESSAKHQLAVMRHDSGENNPDDTSHVSRESDVHHVHDTHSQQEKDDLRLKLGEGKELSATDMSGAEGSRISVVEVHDPMRKIKTEGKTVRQLSRLWRYQGGRDPDHDY